MFCIHAVVSLPAEKVVVGALLTGCISSLVIFCSFRGSEFYSLKSYQEEFIIFHDYQFYQKCLKLIELKRTNAEPVMMNI